MERKSDSEETRLDRDSRYGLIREQLLDLMILSRVSSEAKAVGALYYLLYFVQGKRRFPRKSELDQIVADCLDRNLGRDEFLSKWQLNLSQDPAVDEPEQYYLELQQKLALVRAIREGWKGWRDGA